MARIILEETTHGDIRNGCNSNFSELYTAMDTKQTTLVNGTSIKLINGVPVLGSGNIVISSGSSYVVNVKAFGATGDGTTNDSSAINAAIATLVEGDTLYFPKGTYLVTPQLTAITDNKITVLGENATIKTASATLYNIIFRVQADNCVVDGITFDQMGDVAQLPNAGAFQGCHTIYAQTFQSFTVRNCKFYTYGVTAILTQPLDTYGTGTVTIENCEFIFERQVSTYYDVSVVNADAMTVVCKDNKVISVNGGVGSTVWYAESAYELHGPNIIATNNEANYCINHILPVNWPMLYTTYDANYRGSWLLEGNFGHHLLRGINSWGAHTVANAVTRNFVIANNVFNLHASTGLTPVLGIAFSNGSIDASFIKHGKIVNNVISFTKNSGIVEDDILSGITTSSIYGGVGGISFNNSNSCEDILVSGNSIINFPGPAFNLICRQDDGTNQHKRIKIINNTIVNGDYSTYYDLAEKGLFILKDCTGITIEDNEIIRNSEVANATKALLSIVSGVTDVKFVNNKVIGQTTSGYRYGVDGTITSVTSDNVILRWYGALKANADVYSETTTKPDGTYNIGDRVLYDGASSISKRGYKCTTAGTIRTISGVTGTWANATQIYVSPTTELKVGDIVAFPGGQTSIVVHASGNYIYTGSSLTTWSGGQALTLKTPVFADII